MTAEKIIEQIKKDSQKEIKQILEDTKKQATSILKEARKEAEQESDKILSYGTQQSENIKKILISKANQDTKREIMNAREEIIEECFTKAHHKLSILKGKEYERIVKKLVEDGRRKLGGECSLLVSRGADKTIAGDLGIPIDGKVETAGGVVLKSVDGRVTLDHTFDGILEREKAKIRRKVGKLLFS
jgi:vacuolar-type H+-ATPase subunit E/Vma4